MLQYLSVVEVVGLTTGGGRIDGNRVIYLTNGTNLNLFADFYGKSLIEPLQDIGKVLLTIYGKDFKFASEFSWHKPNIYKLTIPPKDYNKVTQVQSKFNRDLAENQGKDITVTQAVELLNSGGTSNHGDLAGLVNIQNECIDVVAGFYNIPPFLLAKGKAGRLGGNANREEIDSFLEIEIRPEQEILENIIEKQFYDRVLAILFMVEPEDVEDETKVPIRMRHFYQRPEITTDVDVEQYEIRKDMRNEGLISQEDFMDKLGIRNLNKDQTLTGGEDITPTIKTWQKTNRFWKPRDFSKDHPLKNWSPKNIGPIHNRSPIVWNGEQPQDVRGSQTFEQAKKFGKAAV